MTCVHDKIHANLGMPTSTISRHLACTARIIETVLRRQEPVLAAHVERQRTDLQRQRKSILPY